MKFPRREAPHYVVFSILPQFLLMSKYSQQPVLKHPQSVFFP